MKYMLVVFAFSVSLVSWVPVSAQQKSQRGSYDLVQTVPDRIVTLELSHVGRMSENEQIKHALEELGKQYEILNIVIASKSVIVSTFANDPQSVRSDMAIIFVKKNSTSITKTTKSGFNITTILK